MTGADVTHYALHGTQPPLLQLDFGRSFFYQQNDKTASRAADFRVGKIMTEVSLEGMVDGVDFAPFVGCASLSEESDTSATSTSTVTHRKRTLYDLIGIVLHHGEEICSGRCVSECV